VARPKLYTDEDVFRGVAVGVRKRGIDVLTVPEAGQFGLSDEEQLRFATGQGRCLFSFNARDYAVLHGTLMANGEHHAGIIVSPQTGIGAVLRALLRELANHGADDLVDQLIWVKLRR
jgi:hypothetical protein